MSEDDKKTDKVISMSEFLKEVDSEDSGIPSFSDLCSKAMERNPQKVVLLCEGDNGQMSFYTNCSNYPEIIFFLESYKKIILDYTVGEGYSE